MKIGASWMIGLIKNLINDIFCISRIKYPEQKEKKKQTHSVKKIEDVESIGVKGSII